jgi:hypothetical protein
LSFSDTWILKLLVPMLAWYNDETWTFALRILLENLPC